LEIQEEEKFIERYVLEVIMVMYVDHLSIIGNDEHGVAQYNSQLMAKFLMNDLGLV
jgi:hypothetical protein